MPWSRRVEYIPQLAATECGAACLCMVLRHHGASLPLAEVRARCDPGRDGASVHALWSAARSFGLDARALRAEPATLDELPWPAILHWQFDHFVVLERSGRRGAVIVDPAVGRRRVSLAELDAAYTGVVIALQPGAQFRRRRSPSVSLARYWLALRDCPAPLLMLGALMLALELLGLATPVANQVLVDHVLLPERQGWLVPLLAALCVATGAQLAAGLLRDRLIANLTLALDLTLVQNFVEHLLALPLAFLEQRTTGELLQRVQANATLRELSAQLWTSAFDALLVLSYSALMLAYDALLGSLVIAVNLLHLLLLVALSRQSRELGASALGEAGRESSALLEGLTLPEAVRAFGIQDRVIRRFGDRLVAHQNAKLDKARFETSVAELGPAFDALAAACVLGVGGSRVIDGQLSAGVLVGMLTLRQLLSGPFGAQVKTATALIDARGIIARIDDVMDNRREPSGARVPGPLRGQIELVNLRYRHSEADPWLCDDLSVSIRAGEKIAIVGRTGCGKTTLGKLLLGLLEPLGGQLLFDGMDLASLDRAALRRQIGVVPQEPFVFDETVITNMRLGRPDATLGDVRHAARLACVDDVIAALPDGYDTRLGPGGGRLSRGQRQRLVLARALVAEPRILLLDEATSSLDSENEAAVHANLAALSCTRIVIAHRLATVRDADRILVLEGGKITQQGRFDELVAEHGLLRSMAYASAD